MCGCPKGWRKALQFHRWPGAWLLLAIASVAGCERLPGPAVKQIRQAHQAYEHRQYAQSERMLGSVIAEHAGKPDVAEAHYVRGLCRLNQDHQQAARSDFEAGLAVADRAELRALLHAQLGNLDYEAGDYAQAAAHYRAAKDDLPERSPFDRVLLRYAESLRRQGDFREAKRVWAELLLKFPQGSSARLARRKLADGDDHYSIQCGVYSKPAYAQKAAEDLRSKGIPARAWKEQRNGTTRHVVRTGQYRTYAEAQQALQEVRRHVPDAFIVP